MLPVPMIYQTHAETKIRAGRGKAWLGTILFAVSAAWAQPAAVTVRASYPTQTVLCAEVADPMTSYSISVTADGNPIHDINPALFAGAGTDLARPDTATNGNERCIVIGHRSYETALNGKVVSRATEADKLHAYNWGGATGTFQTPTIPLNNSASDPVPAVHPTLSYNDPEAFYIDAFTGARVKHFDLAGIQRVWLSPGFNATELGTNWNGISNALSDEDSSAYASYSGTSQDWLYLRGPVSYPGQQLGETPAADNYGLVIKGYCSGADCGAEQARIVDAQMTCDGVNWSPTYQLTLPNGSESTVELWGPSGSTPVVGSFWLPDSVNCVFFERTWGTGLLYTSGDSATASFTNGNDCGKLRVGDPVFARGVTFTVASLNCGGSPAQVTFNFAFDLSPTDGFPGWSFQYGTGLFQNVKMGFRIRKNSTTHASAEIRIQYASRIINASDVTRSSSGGFQEHCSKVPRANGRVWCIFGDRLYSVHPVSGDVIYTAAAYMSCPGMETRVYGFDGSVWSNLDPNRMYVRGIHLADGSAALVKIDITADDETPGEPFYVSGAIPQPNKTCTDLTPVGSTLADLLEDYDPHYNRTLYTSIGVGGILANDDIFIVAYRGSQDSRTYLAVFAVGNGQPVNTTGTGHFKAGFYIHEGACNYATHYCMASMGLHTVFTLDDGPGVLAFQPSGLKNEFPGENSRYIQISEYWDGDSWEPGLPIQSAGTITRIHVTTEWNPSWGNEPMDFEKGDPVSDCTTGGCVNTGDTSGDYWNGALKKGTLLCRGYGSPECMWVANIISPTEIEVERGAYANADPSTYAPQDWSSGAKIRLANMEFVPAGLVWKYDEYPDGQDSEAFVLINLPGGGHSVMKNFYLSGSPDVVSYVAPDGIGAVTSQYINSSDMPNAVSIPRAAIFGGENAVDPGECTEGHPSVMYEKGGRLVFADSHPVIGGPGCFNTPNSQATLVTWPIFKWSSINIHPKHFPTLASTGSMSYQNISGPGSLLTTSPSDYNKVCRVLTAGECYAGSSAGEVYISAPRVRPGQAICTNVTVVDDLCVGDTPSEFTRINIYNAPTKDNFDDPTTAAQITGTSVLTGVGLTMKPSVTTHNAKALPGGNWLYYMAINATPRRMGMMVKVPSNWEYDGIDRTTFLSRAVAFEAADLPAGTARVAVKFGYDTDYRCSVNRNEACYAVTAAVNKTNPFLWASEWTSPASQSVACGSGCLIEIPATYGRVLHLSVVYLNAGGQVIAASPRRVEAASPALPPVTGNLLQIRGTVEIQGEAFFK